MSKRPAASVAEHVAHTVETVASIHAHAEQKMTAHQRMIERLTALLGRPAVVYGVVLVAATWALVNFVAARAGGHAIDPPPFAWMQCIASVVCVVMTVMVLTTQNRQAKHAEQRAQLDLQINLLAEQKAAKIISLLVDLRRDLPFVDDRHDPVADAMSETVDPEKVMEVFEQTLEAGDDPDEDPRPTDHPEVG